MADSAFFKWKINRGHPVIAIVTPRFRFAKSVMTASDYLALAERYCRFLEAAKITDDEYAENLLTSCVTYPEVDENTAHKIAGTIPDSERVEREISKVLDESYRFPTLHYGGPGPSSEVQEETRRLYEARIRICATLLARTLNTV